MQVFWRPQVNETISKMIAYQIQMSLQRSQVEKPMRTLLYGAQKLLNIRTEQKMVSDQIQQSHAAALTSCQIL
jgi:hypothetical protein